MSTGDDTTGAAGSPVAPLPEMVRVDFPVEWSPPGVPVQPAPSVARVPALTRDEAAAVLAEIERAENNDAVRKSGAYEHQDRAVSVRLTAGLAKLRRQADGV